MLKAERILVWIIEVEIGSGLILLRGTENIHEFSFRHNYLWRFVFSYSFSRGFFGIELALQ